MSEESFLEDKEGNKKQEEQERQMRDFVFMVLQVRILNKIGLIKDVKGEPIFSESHMESNGHLELSAVLRGLIEEELNEMGLEGVSRLNDIFCKMENRYFDESKEVEGIVDGLAMDFERAEWDPRVIEYLREHGVVFKNLM